MNAVKFCILGLVFWTVPVLAEPSPAAGRSMPGTTPENVAQTPRETVHPAPAYPETIRIPFTLDRNKIILPVTIDSTGPLKIIFDSGMGSDGLLLFKSKYIKELKISDSTEYQVQGAGNKGSSKTVMAEGMTFKAGDAVFENQRVIILTSKNMEHFPTDGVTGYSLLGHYAVEIDYDRMEITLHDPEYFKAEEGWEMLPVTFKENRIPWVDLTVEVQGDDPVTLPCYIDSASGETVELLIRETNPFTVPDGMEKTYLGRGLSGDIYGHRGPIRKVRLGKQTAENIDAVFAPAEVRSKQPDAGGVIGNGLLKRFHVMYDYAHEKLYIRPR